MNTKTNNFTKKHEREKIEDCIGAFDKWEHNTPYVQLDKPRKKCAGYRNIEARR